MKTNFKLLSRFFTLTLIILVIACSKDDSGPTDPDGNGEVEELAPTISTDEFETDEGVFSCTKEHLMPIIRDDEKILVRADEITENDMLIKISRI